MPIYRYRCTNCEAEFEEIMTIVDRCNDKTLIFCPSCGCGENTPMLSKTSFSLKGGGWYATDYSGKTTGSSTETESESESTTESKSESTTESKSESTTESKSESTTESKSESTSEATSSSEDSD